MRILVRHAPPFRRWHLVLGQRLEDEGHIVRFEARGPRVGRVLLGLERRLYGIGAGFDASAVAPPSSWTGYADVTMDLCGRSDVANGTLIVEANGCAGEPGLFAAARTSQAPWIRVGTVVDGSLRTLAAGRPAIEDPRVAARATETLLPRLLTLLVHAVARLGDAGCEAAIPDDEDARPPADLPDPVRFFLRGIRSKVVARFGPARRRPEHWRIGLRRDGEGSGEMLPDTCDRFRADPFLFVDDDGGVWLFAEDYPYATRKGIITCQSVAPPTAEAATVLEEPFHLSYPLVLRHDGAIYMLPESAAASRVVLYRAEPFPTRWVAARQLLAGRYADATPILHEGRWWLFATATNDGGSSWDQLHLFHAPDLLGPWVPHPHNPVLIDAGAARPAGHMWYEDGALMRPAQDCRRGYGTGVVVCRVERLDLEGFRQTMVRRIAAPAGAAGLHTINRAGGWEAYDVKAPHPSPERRA